MYEPNILRTVKVRDMVKELRTQHATFVSATALALFIYGVSQTDDIFFVRKLDNTCYVLG